MAAQNAQDVQPPSLKTAGLYPLALTLDRSNRNNFLGQTETQSPQPLQAFSRKMTFSMSLSSSAYLIIITQQCANFKHYCAEVAKKLFYRRKSIVFAIILR